MHLSNEGEEKRRQNIFSPTGPIKKESLSAVLRPGGKSKVDRNDEKKEGMVVKKNGDT